MKNIFSSLTQSIIILLIFLFLISNPANAYDTNKDDFESHMNNWNQNIKLASEYLDKAEKELKNGDAIQSCIKQKQAAKYGIEATESLIKAFKENGSEGDIKSFETGLEKWKELRDFC